MILPRRSFERVPPGREARSVYIFGEGSRREFDYFNYFKELDSRIKKPQIAQVKLKCDERSAAWNLTRSNPCFEVWLYYHKHAEKPEQLSEVSGEWKQLVDSSFGGGFDARKHPLFIQKASENAKKNFN